jgi:hypothetical protein
MIDYLEVKIERWVFAEPNRAHEMRVKCLFNGHQYHVIKIFQPAEIESYFSQIWKHMGQEIQANIQAAQQSGQSDTCYSCGVSFVALDSKYCHACGTRR